MKKTNITELSEIKIPENFAKLKIKDKKEFERISLGDTVFRNKNTLYLFEENSVIIFEEEKE